MIILNPSIFTNNIVFKINSATPVEYSLNDFLGMMTLSKIYLIVRVLLNNTIYASTRAARICRMYGAEGGLFYAAKCLMQEKPLKTVSIMFALSVVVLGHGLRICEEPLMR